MTTYSEIPLIPAPQTFTARLQGVVYNLRVTWCVPSQTWVLDISDIDDAPIILGIPLVTGADLLEQYAYLGIGGQLFVVCDAGPDAVPTYHDLGVLSHLVYVTDT